MGLLTFLFGTSKKFLNVLKSFIPSVEGFSPAAIWDYKQWSWGYGTAAGYDRNKRPTGFITRSAAWAAAEKVLDQLYKQLQPKVKKNLTANQWAALLSFAYNAGAGNAMNIIQTINTGTPTEVVTRMKKYIYAGGKINQGLINRRDKEANLYLNNIAMGAATMYEPNFVAMRTNGEITDFAY